MTLLRNLTIAILLATAPCAADAAQIEVGVARADITPPLGGSLYGYGARGTNTSTGIHDRLYAKALVLRAADTRVALVTLDLGSFGRSHTQAVRDLVAERTGIDHVLVAASHTHSAPRFMPDFPEPARPWLPELEKTIAEVVISASQNLLPARLGVASASADLCHNRRLVRQDGTVEMLWANRDGEPTSPVDKEVIVVAVDDLDGNALATLVNYACHPVVLGPENLEISADYPGAMAATVEGAGGGQTMFLPGAAGDINPFWDKTAPTDGGFEQMEKLGNTLGGIVTEARGRASSGTPLSADALRVERLEIPLEPRWDLDDPSLRAEYERAGSARIFDYYAERFRREQLAEVNVMVLGDELALATFPGEFFVEHGLRLKRESLVPTTLFVGYTNGELGYFPTIRAAAEGGYGATEASFVKVGAGDLLVNRALVRILELSGHLASRPTVD